MSDFKKKPVISPSNEFAGVKGNEVTPGKNVKRRVMPKEEYQTPLQTEADKVLEQLLKPIKKG